VFQTKRLRKGNMERKRNTNDEIEKVGVGCQKSLGSYPANYYCTM